MDTVNYHWYCWEADLVDVSTLESHGLLPSYVSKEAHAITEEIKAQGLFSPALKRRALAVVAEVRKFDESLKEIRRKEQEEYENQPDIPDVETTDDQNGFGA